MPRCGRRVLTGGVAVLALGVLAGCGSGDDGTTSPRPASSVASTPAPATSTAAGSPSSPPSSPASGPASTAPAGSRVGLFFGDSNFVGGGCTPDPTQDMAQIAADQLGFSAVIRGEGGTGFASGDPTYGTVDFVQQIDQGALDVSPAPTLVVIEGGSNDTQSATIEAITQNSETVLRAAQSKYPDAMVVLMGPIDVREGEDDVSPSVVGALKFAAGEVGVPFLDAYDWLPWRTTDGLLCSDFDHATLAGHQILGQRLAEGLTQLGA